MREGREYCERRVIGFFKKVGTRSAHGQVCRRGCFCVLTPCPSLFGYGSLCERDQKP